MARGNVTVKELVVGGGQLTSLTPTTIDPVNNHNINNADKYFNRSLFLLVVNTTASPKNVTLKAGVGGNGTNGPSNLAPKGDVVYQVAATSTALIGPIEAARHTQLDGSVNVDFETGMTGNFQAYSCRRY